MSLVNFTRAIRQSKSKLCDDDSKTLHWFAYPVECKSTVICEFNIKDKNISMVRNLTGTPRLLKAFNHTTSFGENQLKLKYINTFLYDEEMRNEKLSNYFETLTIEEAKKVAAVKDRFPMINLFYVSTAMMVILVIIIPAHFSMLKRQEYTTTIRRICKIQRRKLPLRPFQKSNRESGIYAAVSVEKSEINEYIALESENYGPMAADSLSTTYTVDDPPYENETSFTNRVNLTYFGDNEINE